MGYNEIHCKVLFSILESVFKLQVETGYFKYEFTNENDMSIVHPFYEDTGRFIVNPINEYNALFFNSNFIELLENIKSDLKENPTIEKMNLCIAKNVADIQFNIIKQIAEYKNKNIFLVIQDNLDSLYFVEYNEEIIINPFENNELKEAYKEIFFQNKFSKLLIS